MGGALVLFTRDLRVRDQRALTAALSENERVVPAFVLDEHLLAGACGSSPNRLAFLRDCVLDLDRSLRERGGALVVRRGDVVAEAMALAAELDLGAIHMSADHTPYARARARRLERACAAERVALRTHPGVTVLAPGEATPAGADHYRVFTPYWRVWSSIPAGEPSPAPRRIVPPAALRASPAAEMLDRFGPARGGRPAPSLARGGETEARALVRRFVRSGLARYGARRDELAAGGTSQLSAHLHFGSVSARALLAAVRTRAGDAGGAEGFARQLCCRDFHHQVLAARPDMTLRDYRPRGDRWRRSVLDAEAWRSGRTGYPIVDAGMRQLAAEGYMHNRARMIVASFLTKTLYLDWRLGAAHFAALLADADVANNVGNWQWVAGTGNDTRPNRVLNPLRQGERFDPRGEYVRRHVHELAGVEGGAVHRPWLLARGARRGYPPPLSSADRGQAALRRARGV